MTPGCLLMGRRVFELSYRCAWFWGCFVSGNKADLFPPLLHWRICCQHCCSMFISQTRAGSTSPASHTESAEGHCAGDGWVALGDRSRRWLLAGMQMLRSHLSLSPTVLKLGCFPSGSRERLLQEVPKGCAVQTPAEGEVRIVHFPTCRLGMGTASLGWQHLHSTTRGREGPCFPGTPFFTLSFLLQLHKARREPPLKGPGVFTLLYLHSGGR